MAEQDEQKLIELFEQQFKKRFSNSMRQTIINEYQKEEYYRQRLAALKTISLSGMLYIVNQYISVKTVVNHPTIVTKFRSNEMVDLRMILIWIGHSSGYLNKDMREVLSTDRVTILLQIRKMRHIIQYKHIYTAIYQLFTTISDKISTEDERLFQRNLHAQPDTKPDLSPVFDQRSDYTFVH